MSGRYWGANWTGGKSKALLQHLWNIAFGRREYPWDRWRPHHYSDAANTLRNLADCPLACKLLADALEIEIDAGESAADWIAQIATHESLKARATNAQLYADEAKAKAEEQT